MSTQEDIKRLYAELESQKQVAAQLAERTTELLARTQQVDRLLQTMADVVSPLTERMAAVESDLGISPPSPTPSAPASAPIPAEHPDPSTALALVVGGDAPENSNFNWPGNALGVPA